MVEALNNDGNGQRVKHGCTINITTSEALLTFKGGLTWRRTIYGKDGVVDLLFELLGDTEKEEGHSPLHSAQTGNDPQQLELVLSSSVQNQQPIQLISSQESRLQDEQIRMTILTNKAAAVRRAAQGALRIPILISNGFPSFHVRIIVEDRDDFRTMPAGGTARPYYFGKLLTDDFSQPVETFLIWEKETGIMSWLKKLFPLKV